VIVSDNGPQFLSSVFKFFCVKNGIQHTTTSIYCPESNGVVERFHGMVKSMVAKCCEAKGSWPDILPMCLFFMRLTPKSASGFSPFMLAHGWEPNTPSQVLYSAWVGKHLSSMSIEDWVAENAERVQQLRDKASASYHATSGRRKEQKDRTCQERDLEVGDSVWYRTPGLSESLEPSWQGPYTIDKVLGSLTYRIDIYGKPKTVHIKFLKRNMVHKIRRVTTVLEDDTVTDEVIDTNGKARVDKVELDEENLL